MGGKIQASAEELNAKQAECLKRFNDLKIRFNDLKINRGFIKANEATYILDCTPEYLRKLCKTGTLKYGRFTNRYLIFLDSLKAYIENMTAGNIKRRIRLENVPAIKWHFISRQGEKNPLQSVQADKITGYLEEIADLIQRITYEATALKALQINYTTKRLYARVIPTTGATVDIQIARRVDVKSTVQKGELQPLEAKPNKRRRVHRDRDENGRYKKMRG